MAAKNIQRLPNSRRPRGSFVEGFGACDGTEGCIAIGSAVLNGVLEGENLAELRNCRRRAV